MPRQGEGHIAHNAEETGHEVIHGAGKETVSFLSMVEYAVYSKPNTIVTVRPCCQSRQDSTHARD